MCLFLVVLSHWSSPFALVHPDIGGSIRHKSLFRYSYFVIFVDDYSCITWLFLLKNRYELQFIFRLFYKEVKIQYRYHFLTLCFDKARKYIQTVGILCFT